MANEGGRRRSGRRPDTLSALQDVLSKPAIRGLAFEVVERLSKRGGKDWVAPEEEVQNLVRSLSARYPYAAHRFVDRLVDAGVPLARIYHGYLAEAARVLGRRWEKDHASFEEVSLATARVYLIIDELRRRMPPPLPQARSPRLAFAAVPGEQHTLGVEIATDLFRRQGWDVDHFVGFDHDQIVAASEDLDIVLVGLSASGRRRRASLLRLVVALRVVRPDLKIMLSGAITDSEPDLIAQIGIDSIVRDVSEAIEAAQFLVANPQSLDG